jgi:hypothetical protein
MASQERVNWMNFFETKTVMVHTTTRAGRMVSLLDFSDFLKEVEHKELEASKMFQERMEWFKRDPDRKQHAKELRDRHHYYAVYIRQIRNEYDRWNEPGEQ